MARERIKVPLLALESAQEQAALQLIKAFMAERFEVQLGSFEAQEVLDLFAKELAPHFYNKAISDVQAVLSDRFASLESDLWALEKS